MIRSLLNPKRLACGITLLLLGLAWSTNAQLIDRSESAESPDVPAAVVQETDAELVSLLEEIEAASADLKTLKGRVRYTVEQGLLGDEQRRFGDFYYTVANDDHPTQFALHFDRLIVDDKARPVDRRYVFDGYWLLEKNVDDKNAVRRELVPPGEAKDDVLQMGGNSVPIPIQLKADRIIDAYHVDRLADAELGDRSLIHLRLTPLKEPSDETGETQPLNLWFDSQTMMLTKVKTIDGEDTIEIVISLLQPNADLPKNTFATQPPKESDGWTVQEIPLN